MSLSALIDVVLLVWLLGSTVLLVGIEALAYAKDLPSISWRIQNLGRMAPFLGPVVAFIDLTALVHFFPTPAVPLTGAFAVVVWYFFWR